MVSVNMDRTKEEAAKFSKEIKATFPVVVNGQAIGQKYDVSAIPLNVVIDKNGKVTKIIEGADIPTLEAAVKAVNK